MIDPSGYTGPLAWVEYSTEGRQERGHWDRAPQLAQRVADSTRFGGGGWFDAHMQIAHYPRELPWAVPVTYEREGKEPDPDRLNKLDSIPQLANLIIDIDDEDVEHARKQAVRLVDWLFEVGVSEETCLIYYSTGKGFHISIPWQLMGVTPAGIPGLNWRVYPIMAAALAEQLDLESLDEAVYRKNGFIRMADTIHPKTKLFKVRITSEELREHSIENLRKLAKAPRGALLDLPDEMVPVPALVMHYQKAQVKADRKRASSIEWSTAKVLDDETLEALSAGLTPCLKNIPQQVSPDSDNNRNVTAFRAVMMLKYIGRGYSECEEYLRAWLGPRFDEVGARATLDSAFNGPFAGGCTWMRSNGFAVPPECAACPIGRKTRLHAPKREDKPAVIEEEEGGGKSVEQIRLELPMAFDELLDEPNGATIMRVFAGGGKSWSSIRKAIEIAENGGRVVFFVRDTRKQNGLAAETVQAIRDAGFDGKAAILYGRNTTPDDPEYAHIPENCDNWKVVKRYASRGYNISSSVCRSCRFRSSCGYYGQFEDAWEPGIYIAPHAMLPTLFQGEHKTFAAREYWLDPTEEVRRRRRRAKRLGQEVGEPAIESHPVMIGGPLELIVVDEDPLADWISESVLSDWHLERELQEVKRPVKAWDSFTGKMVTVRVVDLDPRWLRVVRWLRACVGTSGPVIEALAGLAEHEQTNIRTVLSAIDESRILDPDFETNGGHRPFTTKLYTSLMADLERLQDGNPVVRGAPEGIVTYGVREIPLPDGVPIVFLDAYARPDRYKAFFDAAHIHRPVRTLDFVANEHPVVTYVLGASLSAGVVSRALEGQSWAVKIITDIVEALKMLTEDGERTLIVARRNLIQSSLLRRLIADSPHLVAEDDETGSLHFWRGRGINSATGERIAVLQDPNPPPQAVLTEAIALFPNQPRLDDRRVKGAYEVPWAPGIPGATGWTAERWDYADERLNMINRTLREDELVQMSLRGRSITTRAGIILFSNYVDPRLPASRVESLPALVGAGRSKAESPAILKEALIEAQLLSWGALVSLGLADGSADGVDAALMRKFKRENRGIIADVRQLKLPESELQQVFGVSGN